MVFCRIMKKSSLVWCFVLLFACDGIIVVEVETVVKSEPLPNVDIRLYLTESDFKNANNRAYEADYITHTEIGEIRTDSLGFFRSYYTVAPQGSYKGYIIGSKHGFVGDTINFEYSSPRRDTVKLRLELK